MVNAIWFALIYSIATGKHTNRKEGKSLKVCLFPYAVKKLRNSHFDRDRTKTGDVNLAVWLCTPQLPGCGFYFAAAPSPLYSLSGPAHVPPLQSEEGPLELRLQNLCYRLLIWWLHTCVCEWGMRAQRGERAWNERESSAQIQQESGCTAAQSMSRSLSACPPAVLDAHRDTFLSILYEFWSAASSTCDSCESQAANCKLRIKYILALKM